MCFIVHEQEVTASAMTITFFSILFMCSRNMLSINHGNIIVHFAVLQNVLDTSIQKQVGKANLDSEFQLSPLNDKAFRATWTLNLNEFFYNYIMSRNEEVLESVVFSGADSNRDYQLILSPRAYDSWRHQNCSLFLYRSGDRSLMPKRLIFRCRIPGTASEDIQYFEVLPNRDSLSYVGDGYIIAKIFFFVSYSFFLQHLNVCPYFQIIADVML